MDILPIDTFPHLDTLVRLALALAVGLFVGLEREWRGKEAGLRTFGFAALLGGLGGLLGEGYALVSLALLGILVIFLNVQSLYAGQGLELTTSAALLVTGFTGVLCGIGHTFTPVAVAVGSAALLAWKERLAGFSLGLTAAELRSAILLALLAFVVYPALPATPLDPWGLVEPQTAWVTVILIAAIGFANYVLLKIYGARGAELAGFLGGLVNSTVTVTELAGRAARAGPGMREIAYRGVLLSTAAMAARNAILLGILAVGVLADSVIPMSLLLLSSVGLALGPLIGRPATEADGVRLRLGSPFSLPSALRFGVIFLAIQVAGTLAQWFLGTTGFYAVSLAGGVASSASAVASAATLASQGWITPQVAGTGAVLASLASALVNLALVSRLSKDRTLTLNLARSLVLIVAVTLLGVVIQELVGPSFAHMQFEIPPRPARN